MVGVVEIMFVGIAFNGVAFIGVTFIGDTFLLMFVFVTFASITLAEGEVAAVKKCKSLSTTIGTASVASAAVVTVGPPIVCRHP